MYTGFKQVQTGLTRPAAWPSLSVLCKHSRYIKKREREVKVKNVIFKNVCLLSKYTQFGSSRFCLNVVAIDLNIPILNTLSLHHYSCFSRSLPTWSVSNIFSVQPNKIIKLIFVITNVLKLLISKWSYWRLC